MTVFEVQSPKGKTYEIEAATMPSGAQLQILINRMESKSVAEGFVDRGIETVKGMGSLALDAAKSAMTPEGQAGFLPRLASGMYEGAVQSGADAIARQLPNGIDKNLTYTQAARAGAAAVPVLGPYVMNYLSDIEEGKGAEATGGKLFDAAATLLPGSKVGNAAARGAVDASLAAGRGAAKVGGMVARSSIPEVVATTAGAVAGAPAGIGGAIGGAAAAYQTVKALRAVPELFQATRDLVAKVRGVSGARAEAILQKMPAEELAATVEQAVNTPAQVSDRAAYKAKVQEGVEARRKAYWDAHPKPEAEATRAQAQNIGPERPLPRSDKPELQALTAEDLANARGDIFKHGEAPAKAAPAPEPAPVQAKPAAEPVKASPGQNARDWIQKYSAADAEGRRALVKGLGGKLNYEDMRQLAAYTDDLTGEASKAPAVADDHFRPVKLDHLKDSAPVVDIPAIAKKLESTPSFDPIMTPEGKGPAQIMGKIQDHPAYKELVAKIKGKSAEEAVQILADAELKDWLIRPTMELAGLDAPTPKMVRAAVERVKDSKYDAWQASERAAAEGDVVTRPHPGQASPAFVNDRLKYLQEQAAKRGDAPAKFAEQVAQNKTKGAELAAMLEQPKTLHSGPRLGESDLDPATVAGIDANAQMLLKDIDASLQSRRGYKEGSHKIRSGDELDLVERIKRSPIKASDLESVLGYGRKDLEGHAKGIVHSSGKPLDTFIEEYLIPEGYVTDVADFGEKLGRALAGEKIFPNGANTGTGTAKAKVAEVAQLIGESPAKIRDALIRDKSNPVELKARRVLNRHDPYDAVAQAEEAYSRMNPDAEPPAGLVNDAPGFPWEKPTARQQGEALHAKAKARGKGKPDQSDIVAKEPPPLGDGHYRAINEEKRAYQLAKGFIWDGENWVHPKYPGELWSSDVVPAPSRSAVMKELAKIRGTSVKAQDMYLERKMAHMAQERLKKAKE